MGLQEYYKKRDFDKTQEPRGKLHKSRAKGTVFVVQKHAARRLHYDLRLEIDGAMKSWAVPKGPSYDPKDKRLAVQTEDHPMEYNSFEGIIPEGEYGAGKVIIWDNGTYEVKGDPLEAWEKGHLHVTFDGEKLKGEWTLVKTHGGEDNAWLLIKSKDDFVRSHDEYDVTKERPESVVSGLVLEEIGEKNPKKAEKKDTKKEEKKEVQRTRWRGEKGKKVERKYGFQLATLSDSPPEGEGWVHEIKLDGYRVHLDFDGKKASFISRNNNDLTDRFSELAEELGKKLKEPTILDGELCVVDKDGKTNFQKLQNAFLQEAFEGGNLIFFAFDILKFGDKDLRKLPLLNRKRELEKVLKKLKVKWIRYSEHFTEDGKAVLERACELGLEGIISKRTEASYKESRTKDWLKSKCHRRQEFVVGGFTESTNASYPFGSLLVGYHGDDGAFHFAGGVGTGFTAKVRRELRDLMRDKTTAKSPFVEKVPGKGATWITPSLIVEVEFTEWTNEGSLRHPSFKGVRFDKAAKEVVREEPEVKQKKGGGKTAAKKDEVIVGGVEISHPDRSAYLSSSSTKEKLSNYYLEIEEWLMPHWKDRPLVLVRCPQGGKTKCFFQKHAREGVPPEVPRVDIQEGEGVEEYLSIGTIQDVIRLVQLNVLEFHSWGSSAKKLEKPDRLVFDLDPSPEVGWREVVAAARDLRKVLEVMGLESWLKSTGGKGLHLVVPITPGETWDVVSDLCHRVSLWVEHHDPSRFTSNSRKASRKGKIFLDYLRNARGASSILPFSTRAREEVPVSAPITWEEATRLAEPFTIDRLLTRLKRLKSDPWEELLRCKQKLPAKSKWPIIE